MRDIHSEAWDICQVVQHESSARQVALENMATTLFQVHQARGCREPMGTSSFERLPPQTKTKISLVFLWLACNTTKKGGITPTNRDEPPKKTPPKLPPPSNPPNSKKGLLLQKRTGRATQEKEEAQNSNFSLPPSLLLPLLSPRLPSPPLPPGLVLHVLGHVGHRVALVGAGRQHLFAARQGGHGRHVLGVVAFPRGWAGAGWGGAGGGVDWVGMAMFLRPQQPPTWLGVEVHNFPFKDCNSLAVSMQIATFGGSL